MIVPHGEVHVVEVLKTKTKAKALSLRAMRMKRRPWAQI